MAKYEEKRVYSSETVVFFEVEKILQFEAVEHNEKNNGSNSHGCKSDTQVRWME